MEEIHVFNGKKYYFDEKNAAYCIGDKIFTINELSKLSPSSFLLLQIQWYVATRPNKKL